VYRVEYEAALDAVTRAARLCMRVRATLAPAALAKRDRSPVTVADFGSQAIVGRALGAAFPDVPLIAEEDSAALREVANEHLLRQVVEHTRAELAVEELDADEVCAWIDRGSASEYSQRFWCLDPIDGTKGFLRGDQYAIALALCVEGEPVVAALACPGLEGPGGGRGAIFMAERGAGVTAYALDHHATTRVCVSPVADPAASRLCESVESAHSDHSGSRAIADALGISAESVRMDSQAKYAAVARGDAEIYLRLPTRPGYVERIWDHAAGCGILREAGGTITDIDGKPLDFTHGRGLEANRGIAASNGHVHDQLLAAIAAQGI